jgi:hypothetical protein
MIDPDRTPTDPHPSPIERLIADVNELRAEIREATALMRGVGPMLNWHTVALGVVLVVALMGWR